MSAHVESLVSKRSILCHGVEGVAVRTLKQGQRPKIKGATHLNAPKYVLTWKYIPAVDAGEALEDSLPCIFPINTNRRKLD